MVRGITIVDSAGMNIKDLSLKEQGADTLIALTASNDEAPRFYKSIPDSEMHDIGIWIDIK